MCCYTIPAADLQALARLVVNLVDTVATIGSDVVEVELNPVLVGRSGATAVDALLIVEAPTNKDAS